MQTLNILGKLCHRVELVWIKAHNNYLGDERADELARNAVFNNIIYFDIYLPHSFFKQQLKEVLLQGMDRHMVNPKHLQDEKKILPLPT